MTHTQIFRIARTALVATAIVGTVACGGGGGGGGAATGDPISSPTGVSQQSQTISTQWGDVVVRSEVGEINVAKLEAGIDEAIGRIASQDKYTSLQGVQVVVSNECSGGGQSCYGRYYPEQRLIVALAGYEQVVEHELQHHACHDLGLGNVRGGECCRLQDHPGGYDLSCNQI